VPGCGGRLSAGFSVAEHPLELLFCGVFNVFNVNSGSLPHIRAQLARADGRASSDFSLELRRIRRPALISRTFGSLYAICTNGAQLQFCIAHSGPALAEHRRSISRVRLVSFTVGLDRRTPQYAESTPPSAATPCFVKAVFFFLFEPWRAVISSLSRIRRPLSLRALTFTYHAQRSRTRNS